MRRKVVILACLQEVAEIVLDRAPDFGEGVYPPLLQRFETQVSNTRIVRAASWRSNLRSWGRSIMDFFEMGFGARAGQQATLLQGLKRVPETDRRNLRCGVLALVRAYLHRKGVPWLDIEPGQAGVNRRRQLGSRGCWHHPDP